MLKLSFNVGCIMPVLGDQLKSSSVPCWHNSAMIVTVFKPGQTKFKYHVLTRELKSSVEILSLALFVLLENFMRVYLHLQHVACTPVHRLHVVQKAPHLVHDILCLVVDHTAHLDHEVLHRHHYILCLLVDHTARLAQKVLHFHLV